MDKHVIQAPKAVPIMLCHKSKSCMFALSHRCILVICTFKLPMRIGSWNQLIIGKNQLARISKLHPNILTRDIPLQRA